MLGGVVCLFWCLARLMPRNGVCVCVCRIIKNIRSHVRRCTNQRLPKHLISNIIEWYWRQQLVCFLTKSQKWKCVKLSFGNGIWCTDIRDVVNSTVIQITKIYGSADNEVFTCIWLLLLSQLSHCHQQLCWLAPNTSLLYGAPFTLRHLHHFGLLEFIVMGFGGIETSIADFIFVLVFTAHMNINNHNTNGSQNEWMAAAVNRMVDDKRVWVLKNWQHWNVKWICWSRMRCVTDTGSKRKPNAA